MFRQLLEYAVTNSGGDLPSGYQRLQYIESDGTQYIDTLYTPGPNTGAEVTYQFTSLSNQQRVFGIQGRASTQHLVSFSHYINGSTVFAYTYTDGDGNWKSTSISADTNKHIFCLNKTSGIWQLDETSNSIVGTITEDSNDSIYIMACNDIGQLNKFASLKLYGFKIYESGVLARNFIPAYSISDDEAGLYEVTTEQFFIDENGGSFSYG